MVCASTVIQPMVLVGFKPTIVVRWLLLPKYVVLLLLFLLATSIKVAFKNHIKSSELPYPRCCMDM